MLDGRLLLPRHSYPSVAVASRSVDTSPRTTLPRPTDRPSMSVPVGEPGAERRANQFDDRRDTTTTTTTGGRTVVRRGASARLGSAPLGSALLSSARPRSTRPIKRTITTASFETDHKAGYSIGVWSCGGPQRVGDLASPHGTRCMRAVDQTPTGGRTSGRAEAGWVNGLGANWRSTGRSAIDGRRGTCSTAVLQPATDRVE